MTEKKYDIIGASISGLMLLFLMFVYMLVPFNNVKLNSVDNQTVSASGSLYLSGSKNLGSDTLYSVNPVALLPIESTNFGGITGYRYGSFVYYRDSSFSSTSQVVDIRYNFGFSNLIQQDYLHYGYASPHEFETFLRKFYNNLDDWDPYGSSQIQSLYLNCGVINLRSNYYSSSISELVSDANSSYDYSYSIYYDNALLFRQYLRDNAQNYFYFTPSNSSYFNRAMFFDVGAYCNDNNISIFDFISKLSVQVKYWYNQGTASRDEIAIYIPYLTSVRNFGFDHAGYNLIVDQFSQILDYSYYFGAETSVDYQSGYDAGVSDGYSRGWNAGAESASSYTFLGLIGAVLDAPIQAFTGLFNFTILGVNLKDFILGLFTICVILTIVKFVL